MASVKKVLPPPSFMRLQVKKSDEKTHMLTAEETLQFQKKVSQRVSAFSHRTSHHPLPHVQVKSVDAEEELGKTLSDLDIDHWVNKRVPRPPGWED